MNEPSVLILLATYNGAAFIRPMVDSVLAQDVGKFRLVLSDDGSTDETAAILDDYAAAEPEKVIRYRSDRRFGCAQKHFLHLLQKFHDADYILFCDQDDLWHPDKVRKTLARMRQIEKEGVPALVHTDLRVVDRDGGQIAPSFCQHSALDGNRTQLHQLLVQNVVTGCTVMINRALAELTFSGQIPEEDLIMHDWWLALLASACGSVTFLDEATIDYRQHGNNSVGAKNVHSPRYLLYRLRSKRMREAMVAAAVQAQGFLTCYEGHLTEEQKELVAAFASTKDAGLLKRDRIYMQYGLMKKGFVRKTAQLLGL